MSVQDFDDFLSKRHDRFMNNGGWFRNADGKWVAVPIGDQESGNMWVTKANEVFAIRAAWRQQTGLAA